MLDTNQHEYYLKKILRDIISDVELSGQLAFKGGTCLYLFYGLSRFSVDLDFNFISDQDFKVEKMNQILNKYLDIKNGRFKEGQSGWLWEASYKKGERQMQVDINKRVYPDKYEIKQFYGLSIKTLAQQSLFAHKLCAILDRKRFQNRDLFDAWFMFDNNFEISNEVIKFRTNKNTKEYLLELMGYIKNNVNKSSILQGMGELISEKQKHWVKTKLINELLAQIQMKIDCLD
ncbi:nucleotidyl transferase AbiEii/AbiGii toxin family protein [Candidatus Pacearchaeota archaeon]|nr:nucleotidyl transferase AbiEii/AbiGii toxin family protein [Candidatus Pacearchaeota archaeon]PJC43672.1 MAG: hypothetical protein CO039_02870 [Candidatus Pacebacteria bacterium CG_4_9_14_0_2_um_filter_34_50]